MAFRSWAPQHIAKFNSAASSEFLDFYENYVDEQIKKDAARPSNKTFAASSFRCDRKSWFRLRGVQPDTVTVPDRGLQFTADIGTACHRIIQTNLKAGLKENWLSVSKYLNDLEQTDYKFTYNLKEDEDGLETLVEVTDPYPVRFACDGLIRWNDTIYLLEIKTSEYSSWNDMTDPKEEHIDQVKCYATLLHLDNVLFLYQDRQHGDFKCYELKVTSLDKENIVNRFEHVMKCVKTNLAPDPLPKGDKWCNPSMCPYYKKCSEYGR